MITIEGEGHMIQNEALSTYLDDMLMSLYDQVTFDAEVPAGCL